MTDRLDKICFLPPPIDTPWTGPPPDPPGVQFKRRDGCEVQIDLPLFWFEPAWHHVAANVADQIAVAVADQGLLVSALHSDLSGPKQASVFCSPLDDESHQGAGDTEIRHESSSHPARILPYRAERYGFQPRDLIGPRVIDVRLSIARDPKGHYGYSPRRIERWKATPTDRPLAGGGWVPAASFLPDVPSLEHLGSKLDQLRILSPRSAVFVSFSSHRLRTDLPSILETKPDGLILRLNDIPLTGMQVAEITVLARKMTDELAGDQIPLWVVPGPMSPDDAVKLLALGASAIAVDDWCEEVIESVAQAKPASQMASGYQGYQSSQSAISVLRHVIEEKLTPKVERFEGLCTSLRAIPCDQRLACLSGRWAKSLGIPALAMPRVTHDS
ncbi:MAG: hypothetical protein P8L85_10020 [Rubripirellula sp.]|nr:hypothetical protein [Rubripirellula sp.]